MEEKKIVEMTPDELVAEVKTQSEALFKYRFQLATGQIQNPAKIRALRRHIARLKTAQRANELKSSTSA